MTDLSDRLDRIDVKPDKLSEAVSQLGRIKNTFAIRHESMGQIDSRLNDIEVRIRTLEHQSSSRGVLVAGFKCFGFIFFLAPLDHAFLNIKH